MQYLGYIVSVEEVITDPEKLKAASMWTLPKTNIC
jgi:hypothetical protein